LQVQVVLVFNQPTNSLILSTHPG